MTCPHGSDWRRQCPRCLADWAAVWIEPDDFKRARSTSIGADRANHSRPAPAGKVRP